MFQSLTRLFNCCGNYILQLLILYRFIIDILSYAYCRHFSCLSGKPFTLSCIYLPNPLYGITDIHFLSEHALYIKQYIHISILSLVDCCIIYFSHYYSDEYLILQRFIIIKYGSTVSMVTVRATYSTNSRCTFTIQILKTSICSSGMPFTLSCMYLPNPLCSTPNTIFYATCTED